MNVKLVRFVMEERLQKPVETAKQADVAILLGATSGTKVSRYENFKRMPDPVTVFALEIVYRQPARELFAGSYDKIRASVQERARRMVKQLNARPEKQDKKTLRKLEFLSAIVRQDPDVIMVGENARRVLAVDPFSGGVGFAVLEGQDNLIDWGIRTTGRADNVKSAGVIDKLIDRFRPDVLVLEHWDSDGSRRCSRVEKLLGRIAAQEGKRILVRLVTKSEVRTIGPLPQTSTKYGRASILAERFRELQAYLPPVRKPWMPEDDRMAIFDALSFALACVRTKKSIE